jgi:hypothetical protein
MAVTHESGSLNCIVINLQFLLGLPYELKRFRNVKARTFRHGIKAIVHLWVTEMDEFLTTAEAVCLRPFVMQQGTKNIPLLVVEVSS